MSNMTWNQMNRLDELTYEAKTLLEVTGDGLSNDVCPSNPEHSASVIRMVTDKIDEIGKIHEEMWNEQRKARFADGGDNEDADGDEDFDTKDIFSDLSKAIDETNLDPKLVSETVYESQKAKEEEPTRSFDVKELKRNEDGSVTYEVSGSDEKMQELFEVFFTHALINGIKYTKEDNQKEIHKMHAITVARELEVLLREWETSEDLDYTPVVRDKRLKLKELLDKAGA